MKRETIFSPCRKYRYTLWREWQLEAAGLAYGRELFGDQGAKPSAEPKALQYLMVIGLNPSTADETNDDATIRRCVGFAKAWGFGALCMTNLFAWRATQPADMKRAENPSGEDNQHHLLRCASAAGLVLAAWGNHGSFMQQDLTVRQWLGGIGVKLHCLGTNADGSPTHPLYIPAATAPVPYEVKTP